MSLKNLFRRKHKTLQVTWVADKYGTETPQVKSEYRDVWCVEYTLTAVVISLLEQLRDHHMGYPAQFNNDEEWVKELNNGIALFQKLAALDDTWDDNYVPLINEAYGWLTKRLPALWDQKGEYYATTKNTRRTF